MDYIYLAKRVDWWLMTYVFGNLIRWVETMYHVVEFTPKSFCIGISTHNVSAINQCCYSVQTQAKSLKKFHTSYGEL